MSNEKQRKEDEMRRDERNRAVRSSQSMPSKSNEVVASDRDLDKKKIPEREADKSNENVNNQQVDPVHAQYKYVMDNLEKENKVLHDTQKNKSPAMKKYEKFEKNIPKGRQAMLERIREKSLREANQNERGR